MTTPDLTTLLPLLVLSGGALITLVVSALRRNHLLTFSLTLITLLASFLTLPTAAGQTPRQVTPLLIMDQYALFFIGFILVTSLVIAVLTYRYLQYHDEHREEYYVVLMLAALGSGALVASSHFISLFLGLELLTVSLYVMIAYLRTNQPPLEAGVKYLILAAASSAFLLFGMALLYAEIGTMEFAALGNKLAAGGYRAIYVLTGTALVLTGAGFKLAVVPFHMWTPDVYEGAPAPVTAFVATASKGAMFALLLRYFLATDAYNFTSAILAVSVIAIASMLIGNFLALLQTNVKRLLAYSSISHLGYILVALVAGGPMAAEAVLYYLVVYSASILGAFGIITLLTDGNGEPLRIEDYRGLFWTRPGIAIAMTAVMLSLAGIPLTAGFVGKFLVLTAGVGSAQWTLSIVLVISSAIGLYYYLRVIVAMFTQVEEDQVLRTPITMGGGAVLTVLTFIVIYLGVYPAPLVRLIENVIGSVV